MAQTTQGRPEAACFSCGVILKALYFEGYQLMRESVAQAQAKCASTGECSSSTVRIRREARVCLCVHSHPPRYGIYRQRPRMKSHDCTCLSGSTIRLCAQARVCVFTPPTVRYLGTTHLLLHTLPQAKGKPLQPSRCPHGVC
eukprot:1440777-Prymnesium_polylepis.1